MKKTYETLIVTCKTKYNNKMVGFSMLNISLDDGLERAYWWDYEPLTAYSVDGQGVHTLIWKRNGVTQ